MLIMIQSSTSQRKKYLYYLLLFLTAVLAMLPVVLLHHPLKYDMIDQAYPWRYFIGECLQNGNLPLWNPYQLLGSPIHADPQSSAWYPVTWFFGYFFGYDIYVISFDFFLHIFLAGMGMFYLGKQLKFRDETAFIMGISYMLSGFFIGNAQHFMWIISGTWIPFITGAFLALKNSPSVSGAIKLGLAFFMIMTGGYPAFIFLLLYMLAAIFILFAVDHIRKREFATLLRFAKFLGLAAVFTILAGIVIIISVYHLQDAMTRGSGVTLKQALFGAFTLKSFISFLLPFASIRNMDFYGTDLSMSNAYFGLLTLVFFLTGLMVRRSKLVNLFLFWGLFCLTASVGSILPVRELLYHYVPFMSLFRFPALFRIFFILSFIIVAGFAFDGWRKEPQRITRKLWITTLGVAAVLVAFVVYAVFQKGLNMNDFIRNQLLVASEKSSIVQHILFQGIVQLIFLALFVFLITKWQAKKHALTLLLLIIALDMIIATLLNGPYTVYYDQINSKETYRYARQFREGFPIPGNRPLIENKDSGKLIYQALWRNLNIFQKQVSFEGYNPVHLKGFEEIADNHPKLFETILQNPLVYLSDRISPLDSLAFQEKDSNYLKGRVYFDEDIYKMLKVEGLMLNAGDSVIITAYSPVGIHAVSKTKNKVLVNLLQNNYYGWKASIDGKPVDILTGNMSFISVEVPAGTHDVVFSCDPVGVKIGFWITLISLIMGICFLIINSLTTKAHKGFSQRRAKDIFQTIP
jgi:hypothetical protein